LRGKTKEKVNGDGLGTVDAVVGEIIKKNEERRANRPVQPVSVKPPVPPQQVAKPEEKPHPAPPQVKPQQPKPERFVLVSKIRDIVGRFITDSSTVEAIIAKIEEELL
jgi:hypothetical protein